MSPLLTSRGAYADIAAEDYHDNPDLLPGASISSTGLKTMLAKSPRHFWWSSPLNPDRPTREDKRHFAVGKAAHDVLLLSARWPDYYHVLPDGYIAPSSRTKNLSDAQVEALDAEKAGKCLLRCADAETVNAMAASIRANPLAAATLTAGDPEMTLVWQDKETGVWLRARPDFLPHQRRAIPDLKTAADGSPEAFSRAIATHGYAQSAALYLDGIKTIFGDNPEFWLHIVVEKDPPHVVSLYQLPGEDIERGRALNRFAIRAFAKCLETDKWPGYADEPAECGLPGWRRHQIDQGNTPEGVAWAEAVGAQTQGGA